MLIFSKIQMIKKINTKFFYLFFIICFFLKSNIAQANVRNTIINKNNCTKKTAKYKSEFQLKFLGDPRSPKGHWYYCISSNNSKYEVLQFFDDGNKSINMHDVEKIGYLDIENVERRFDVWENVTTNVYSEEGFPFFGRLTNYWCHESIQGGMGCRVRVLGERINVINKDYLFWF